MPDTASNNQLPPRTTTSTNGSRKWATLGGRAASSSTTKIPTNDSDVNENLSKTNGHQRHSSSLFRKSSTISRTNGTPIPSDENSATSLKKSRSLINVLRSKFNSPAVLRRFRSKSRESTKQTVTEIDVHPINDQQPEIKQSNTEQTTRKSRKRDPSPMRRLANRISQLTRHPRTTSNERQSHLLYFLIQNFEYLFFLQKNHHPNHLQMIPMMNHEHLHHHYIIKMKLIISMHVMMKFLQNILIKLNLINKIHQMMIHKIVL
jgi:hypothetical protein